MATLNINIDDTLKRDTEGILSELGLSISAATTLFYRQVVKYGGIPLELRIDYPNTKTLKALEESKNIIAKGTSRDFSSLSEMRKVMDIENERDDD
jgi:DNA-damage-inducible protein J